jgi:predicted nucleotidyltransferase
MTSIGEALFGKVQQRVLAALFGQPDRSFYVNEIVRLAQSGKGAVQRELQSLVDSGIVTSMRQGNQVHYQANRASAVFDELRTLVVKTFGVADVLRLALLPLEPKIRFACVYGSVAKGTDSSLSDIDLLVVSDDATLEEVLACLTSAETALSRQVNPTLYTIDEVRRRVKNGHSFLTKVLQGKRIDLLGSGDGFE